MHYPSLFFVAELNFLCVPPGSANEGEMVRCVFTGDRSMYDEAAGVIFHARDLELRKLPSRRRQSQLWMYYSEENPLYDHRACGWYHHLNWNSDRQCDKVGSLVALMLASILFLTSACAA